MDVGEDRTNAAIFYNGIRKLGIATDDDIDIVWVCSTLFGPTMRVLSYITFRIGAAFGIPKMVGILGPVHCTPHFVRIIFF